MQEIPNETNLSVSDKLALERTILAEERTLLAKERTYLAYTRTAISFFVAAISLLKILGMTIEGWLCAIILVASSIYFFVRSKVSIKRKPSHNKLPNPEI